MRPISTPVCLFETHKEKAIIAVTAPLASEVVSPRCLAPIGGENADETISAIRGKTRGIKGRRRNAPKAVPATRV